MSPHSVKNPAPICRWYLLLGDEGVAPTAPRQRESELTPRQVALVKSLTLDRR